MRRDRAARAHGDPGLLRRRRLGRDRPARRARRHPGARQRRHLGGRRRAADGRADRRGRRGRRPRLPGTAVAVPRPGGRLRRRRPVATLPHASARWHDDAPARRAAQPRTWGRSGAARSSASTCRGTSRASPPAATCAARWPWSHPGRARRAARASSTPTSRSRSPSWAPRAVVRAVPRKRVALPEGWLDDTDGTGCRRARGRRRDHRRLSRAAPATWADSRRNGRALIGRSTVRRVLIDGCPPREGTPLSST